MNSYPSWRYHRTERAVIVNDPAEEAALGPGWADTPAAFSEPRINTDERGYRLTVPQLWHMQPYQPDPLVEQIDGFLQEVGDRAVKPPTRAERRAAARAAKEAK